MAEATPLPAADPAATATVVAAAAQPCTPTATMQRIMVIGIAAGFVLFVGGIILALGESGETKLKFYQAMAFPFAIIVGATLGALGFAHGKLLEGIVPAGFVPVMKGALTAMAASAGVPATVTVPLLAAIGGGGKDTAATEANTAATQANTAAISAQAASTPHALPAILLMPLCGLLIFAAGGCVSTSAAFKGTIGGGVDNVVIDMRAYTASADWDKNHNGVIDPDEAAAKAQEAANTEALAASVADKAKITLEGVETPWKQAEPTYRQYIASDANLPTAEDKKISTDTADAINRLLQLEHDRQSSLWAKFGISQ